MGNGKAYGLLFRSTSIAFSLDRVIPLKAIKYVPDSSDSAVRQCLPDHQKLFRGSLLLVLNKCHSFANFHCPRRKKKEFQAS